MIEVTYARYGERGSIDVLATLRSARAVLVCEIKSDIPSAEATARKLDEKRRLAPFIVRERLGWEPGGVGAVLVLPESPRLRRLLAGRAGTRTSVSGRVPCGDGMVAGTRPSAGCDLVPYADEPG